MKVIISNLAWVKRTDLSDIQLKFLQEQLTLIPHKTVSYGDDELKPLKLYTETPTSVGVPREYFLARRKPEHALEYRVTEGDTSIYQKYPVTFKGTLRPQQQEAVTAAIHHFQDGNLGGVICLATGGGKSVLGTFLAQHLKLPTLVIVNQEFLLDQWKENIKQFFPEMKVGRVQGKIIDYKDKHITIGMIQSLVNKNYPKEFYEHFGLVIVDEVDVTGAYTFSQATPKFLAKYRVGLSGTLKRLDRCENAFYYHLGPLIYEGTQLMMKPKVRKVWTNFSLYHSSTFNPKLISKPTLLKFLCGNSSRNLQIVDQLIQAVESDRKILVFSERIKHLKVLSLLFEQRWRELKKEIPLPSYGFYIGETEKEDREVTKKCQILFATVQFCRRGFDVPSLDTLFLTTPLSDVVQAVGRVVRSAPNKKDPIIVDFRDDQVEYCKAMGDNRDIYYNKIC